MNRAMSTGEETNLPPARMELQSGLIRTDVPAPREAAAAPKTALPALAIKRLCVYFGANQVLKEISRGPAGMGE